MSGTEPKHRDWVKLWVKEALLGTIREDLTPEERGTWYDFLLLAGNSRVPGVICANPKTAMPIKRIAGILNIDKTLVVRCIKKFKESDRITVDEKGVISIVNWAKYQYSDYDRQKPYREKAKELSALAKSLGFTSVEEYEANEERLKREGRWQSEEDYIAEDAKVITLENEEDGADYTMAMFWADNVWFEADLFQSKYKARKDLEDAFQDKYKGQYSKEDIALFVTKFIKKRKEETEKPV